MKKIIDLLCCKMILLLLANAVFAGEKVFFYHEDGDRQSEAVAEGRYGTEMGYCSPLKGREEVQEDKKVSGNPTTAHCSATKIN
ncbi:MAG: hypothetical protein AABY42_00350 [Nitrospirota bacterium]